MQHLCEAHFLQRKMVRIETAKSRLFLSFLRAVLWRRKFVEHQQVADVDGRHVNVLHEMHSKTGGGQAVIVINPLFQI